MGRVKDTKSSLFWTSYSDLMTSMFFAMLVLFVVIVVAMGSANRELKKEKDKAVVKAEQLEQVQRLGEQFQVLSNSTSLAYDTEKRMFYAKDFVGVEIFKPNKDEIKPEYISMVDKVGSDVKGIIDKLNKNSNSFKYLLVIEGMAAIPYNNLKHGTYNSEDEEMYNLSYRRALSLYNRWKHLNFRDSNTEIIIAGSGFNGINRDRKKEDNNKRFIIQIIPKVEKPSGN